MRKDLGKKGKTPKVEGWYNPGEGLGGWSKYLSVKERRGLALDSRGGGYLSVARALQALANVTKDKETKVRALADSKYFYGEYRK